MKAGIAAVVMAVAVGSVQAAPVLSVDFDGYTPGAYAPADFQADWGLAPSESTGLTAGRTVIAADPHDAANPVLRVTYPAGLIGGNSAMTFTTRFAPSKSYWLQYRVMFAPGFTWVKGGKLPGLGGGDFPTGCLKDGSFDGFTTRLMWRVDGSAWSYLYHPGKKEDCGDNYALGRFEAGPWYVLTQHVVLNDIGQANGSLVQYIDGVEVLRMEDRVWRRSETVMIEGIKMDTFFGGSTLDWAPPSDQNVYFDDFLVSAESPLD
ncbi:polysaccharide lyase [Asticcacaulis sp. AC460]|uniref:polysaccharide lyase n=1 Tax=Asticcacaulis sp. AC460 TaxID=1282360 RepID=UPI00040B790D|nr:hypothetical protein [Asticcacaulis sp. AC460]